MTMFELKTDIYKSGIIEQELHQKVEDQCSRVARWTIDTRDADIKKALVKLGWTPPVDKSMINDQCIYEVGCSAFQTGHCALSHCPKFLRRH